MDDELDRIADIVAARIRSQLGNAVADLGSSGAVGAGDPAHGDSCGEECNGECTRCGHCAVKATEGVRALKENGAVRIAGALGLSDAAGGLPGDLAGMIDHTLLRPDVTKEEISKLCDEARKHTFASVCVNSANVGRCRALLKDTPVKICAVVGFPLGAMATGAKAFEAREAVRNGATEIDMVANIGAIKDGNFALVADDIAKVVTAAHPAKVKVIIETALLNDEQKVAACALAKLAGAHFVKTSTGFSKGGATQADVALMRRVVGPKMGVKASGGIKSSADAARMIEAGANRIGASASVAIVTGGHSTSNY